jgi:hypothetical protein
MYCQWENRRCIHCDYELPDHIQLPAVRECDSTWRAGDDLENLLQAVGIFKEDWVALKHKIGLPPHCNCEARRVWLNKASAHLQVQVNKLKQALGDYYGKPR